MPSCLSKIYGATCQVGLGGATYVGAMEHHVFVVSTHIWDGRFWFSSGSTDYAGKTAIGCSQPDADWY